MEEEKNSAAGWRFDNSYARLSEVFYIRQQPVPVAAPRLVLFNRPLARELGLSAEALESVRGAEIFAGNRLPTGADPLAQAYAGHQFGYFTMLGDGRALLLGEQMTPAGERFDVQIKGSGQTPFSRGGDGRAVLGPMLREYIISEAMFALGIPTTRSLAVAATGESVFRETEKPGAVLTRIAASHIRVGTFEYIARWGSLQEVRELADYTLRRHFPLGLEEQNPYVFLLQQTALRQAALIAKWQLAGFVHGVMNTDNMAISGETIDYGPCAFMDTYDADTVFSSIDRQGRYAYGSQPQIGAWNLARLAETLLPLLAEDTEKAVALAQDVLQEYSIELQSRWETGMCAKLGLFQREPGDEMLIHWLLQLMGKYRADYTNTFIALTFGSKKDGELFCSNEFVRWHEKWAERLAEQKETGEAARQLMAQSNPAIIPRNHRVEEALTAAEKGDMAPGQKLLQVLSCPYAHTREQEAYAQPPALETEPYKTFCGT